MRTLVNILKNLSLRSTAAKPQHFYYINEVPVSFRQFQMQSNQRPVRNDAFEQLWNQAINAGMKVVTNSNK